MKPSWGPHRQGLRNKAIFDRTARIVPASFGLGDGDHSSFFEGLSQWANHPAWRLWDPVACVKARAGRRPSRKGMRRTPDHGRSRSPHASPYGEHDAACRVERADFHRTFSPEPAASVIHAPRPPEPQLAWLRPQDGPHAFALSGVTRTLCSSQAVALLRELVTAPLETYDALVCTSRAVLDMVRRVTGTYGEYPRSWFAGTAAPERIVRWETISLGVADAELVILSVGRLSHHAGRSRSRCSAPPMPPAPGCPGSISSWRWPPAESTPGPPPSPASRWRPTRGKSWRSRPTPDLEPFRDDPAFRSLLAAFRRPGGRQTPVRRTSPRTCDRRETTEEVVGCPVSNGGSPGPAHQRSESTRRAAPDGPS